MSAVQLKVVVVAQLRFTTSQHHAPFVLCFFRGLKTGTNIGDPKQASLLLVFAELTSALQWIGFRPPLEA